MNEEQLTALIRRHRMLGSDIAALKGEQVEIEQKISDVVDTGWKMDVDGVTASKRPGNRKFDPTLAVTYLDDAEKKVAIETRFNEKKLRELVDSKGVLDQCMVERLDAEPVIRLS